MTKYTNNLINETSPYLLQHAHNPVNWYPWGDEALEKAKQENKLILVSIGYSACHWCHVMEHESFENEEIAQIMNDQFVCIKVDREERPDIDQIYMNAVQLIAGNGGWPLNCFAMPDGRPVYGGTYFRPQQWKGILENLAFSFSKEPQKFEKAAADLKAGLKSVNEIVKVKEEIDFAFEDILDIILKLRKNFDQNNGGTYGAPKFPLPVNYNPLIRYYYHSNEQDIYKHINLSLNKIADGGIYDHLGGGFARYSVDKNWLVPHFEKMLYDNAQLISLYSRLYRMSPSDKYRHIVIETIEFLKRDMLSPEGGFFSSFDADSEGVEGKYYLWDKYEIDFLLKDKSELFCKYYNISDNGNWEGRNILHVTNKLEDFSKDYGMSSSELDILLKEAKEILFKQREKRIKPALDDKILTAWNALLVRAFVDAFNTFNNKEYLQLAEKNIRFIEENLLSSNYKLYRNFKNGKATISAFLDDYALLIEAYLELYQATFNSNHIKQAKGLLEYTLKHFFDEQSGMFFYTSDTDQELVSRSIEIMDNVIPSSNSVMAHNLFKLGHLYLHNEYVDMAKQMLINIKDKMKANPGFFGNWIDLLIQFVYKPYEICIVGNNYSIIKEEFNSKFLPNVIYAGGEQIDLPILQNRLVDGDTIIYVCKNQVCNKPVQSFNEAFNQIENL